MPSARFEELLADYLDGALDAAGREALAAEVERDAEAARALEQALAFEALLLAAHREAPEAGRLAAAVGRRAEAAAVLRPASWRVRLAAAAAAALLVAAGAFAYLGLQPPNRVLSGSVLADGRAARRLSDGARIEVAGNVPAAIRLADGSTATLAPESRAVLRGRVGAVRQVVELQRGAGTFFVEKQPRQFKVETPVGSVTVLGTRFSVELRPEAEEAKGEGQMKGRLVLALAVAVAAGNVQVNYDGKDYSLVAGEQRVFAEEARKEAPKSTLPEGLVGFAGQVKGVVAAKVERAFDLKVSEVVKTWAANKATNPNALVGLTIRVTSPWVKVGDKMQQAGTRLAFIQKLQVGQELTLEIKHSERDVFVITELTKEQAAWAKAGGEEPRKEEPKKEEPRKEGESIVGKKFVFSDRAAQATFSGTVAGREGGNLKIKIAESADKRLPAGETVTFFAQWEQVEGKWRVSRAYGEVIERLRAGDKVEGGAFFDEHPRLAYITVTARGEGEKKPEEKKKPEQKKTEGDEF